LPPQEISETFEEAIFSTHQCVQEKTAPAPAACEDNNADAVATAASLGQTVADCPDLAANVAGCDDSNYGDLIRGLCPLTCGMCTAACADDDASAVATAAGLGVTVEGCVDLIANVAACDDSNYGELIRGLCPLTCAQCTPPCGDNDADAVATAASLGQTVADCPDLIANVADCDDSNYGDLIQGLCPGTCGLCPDGSGGFAYSAECFKTIAATGKLP
jgi:hypothetical protein